MSSELARISEFDESKYIVLHPVTINDDGAFSPVLAESISVVQIRTDQEAGEVYHDWRYAPPPDPEKKRPGKYALTALGLGRIAQAAGIQVVSSGSTVRQRDRETGHVYVEWQVTGAVRQPNGELVFRPATATLDTFAFERERQQAYEEQIREGRHLNRYGADKGKPRFTEKDIPVMVRRDVIQLEAKLEERAETLAMNRLTRGLLSLKQVYTQEEIARPFAVPRLIYRPDLTDPVMLERVQVEGRRAVAELYGRSPEPVSSIAQQETAEHVADVRPLPDRSSARAEQKPSSVAAEEPGDGGAGEAGAAAEPARERHPAAPAKPVDDGPHPPKDDPVLRDLLPGAPADLADEHVSRVAEVNPGFLRGVLQGRLRREVRETLEGWVEWTHPTLGSAT